MSLTSDVKIVRYGSPDGHEPLNFGIQASLTVYRGSIAVTAGHGQSHAGYLHPASTVASTDVCWGLIESAGPGSIDGGPGIAGGSSDGAVTANVATGTFFLASAGSSDQLGVNTLGSTVYVVDEVTVGLTSNSNARPVAGVHVAVDTTGQYPGGYAIRLGNNQSTGGL